MSLYGGTKQEMSINKVSKKSKFMQLSYISYHYCKYILGRSEKYFLKDCNRTEVYFISFAYYCATPQK